jgi:hypothetical protein
LSLGDLGDSTGILGGHYIYCWRTVAIFVPNFSWSDLASLGYLQNSKTLHGIAVSTSRVSSID